MRCINLRLTYLLTYLLDSIEVFEILNGFSVVPVDTFFALSDDIRTRGHSMKLLKTRAPEAIWQVWRSPYQS